MTTYAITGASGLLGRYLAYQINLNQDDAVLIGREPGICSFTGNQIVRSDYTVEDLAAKFEGASVVFHLAGVRGGAFGIRQYLANVELSEIVAVACNNANVRSLFNASSISVYTGRLPIPPYCELEEESPANGYGLSKLWAEHAVDRAADERMRVVHGRLGHLFGALERNSYAINQFLAKAIAGEPIHISETAWEKRDFLFANDAAVMIRRLMTLSDKGGVFNIGSGEPKSIGELATVISSVYGVPLIIEGPSERPSSIATYMDISKFQSVIDYYPTPLDLSIQDVMQRERRKDNV